MNRTASDALAGERDLMISLWIERRPPVKPDDLQRGAGQNAALHATQNDGSAAWYTSSPPYFRKRAFGK
jgi:hypothetical protein